MSGGVVSVVGIISIINISLIDICIIDIQANKSFLRMLSVVLPFQVVFAFWCERMNTLLELFCC